ncbi:MAG: SBBP repeat-containing protein, partial [Flavobacteriales bacterium]
MSEQWASRYTGNGNNIDAAADIAVDGSGNIYVTGTSWSTNGNFDILTVKYDDQGNQSWIASYNGNGNAYDEGRAVAFDPSGNVYVAGYADMGSANYDYVLIKYNSSGLQQWVVTYNGTGNGFDEVYDLAVDVAGNAFITGGSDAGGASSNYVTIMYNTAGVQQWVASYNGPGNDIDAAFAMILDGLGSVYVTGHSMGSGSDFDYATVKYNPSGIEQWVARYNGTGNLFDAASAITMDNSGNVIVTG